MIGSQWCIDCVKSVLWNSHSLNAAYEYCHLGEYNRELSAPVYLALFRLSGVKDAFLTFLEQIDSFGAVDAKLQLEKYFDRMFATNNSALALMIHTFMTAPLHMRYTPILALVMRYLQYCRCCRRLLAYGDVRWCSTYPADNEANKTTLFCDACFRLLRMITEQLRIVLYDGPNRRHAIPRDVGQDQRSLEQQLRLRIQADIWISDLSDDERQMRTWASSDTRQTSNFRWLHKEDGIGYYMYKTLAEVRSDWERRRKRTRTAKV